MFTQWGYGIRLTQPGADVAATTFPEPSGCPMWSLAEAATNPNAFLTALAAYINILSGRPRSLKGRRSGLRLFNEAEPQLGASPCA